MDIYWNTYLAKDRYIIYVNNKVYKKNITFDEVFNIWKSLRNK